jgi:hypothetical protein
MSSEWTIITSILSSGGFAALITVFFWNKQKKLEFKWDYKKYILKKRQDAYDEVQKVIHLCLLKKTYHGRYQVNTFFSSDKHLRDFIQYTEIVKSGWVSSEVIEILGKLKGIATEGIDFSLNEDVYHGHDEDGREKYLSISEVLEEYGHKKLKDIEKQNKLLQKAYLSDIKKLGDIDRFTKNINETL